MTFDANKRCVIKDRVHEINFGPPDKMSNVLQCFINGNLNVLFVWGSSKRAAHLQITLDMPGMTGICHTTCRKRYVISLK